MTTSIKSITFSAVTALCVTLSVMSLSHPDKTQPIKQTDTAYERVIKTGILRCSYVTYSPANITDPNTGAMSGIMHDTAEAIGRQLDVKVEWVEEDNWANFMESLRSGRVDAFCGAAYGFSPELMYGESIGPVYYSPIYVWTRPGENRFNDNVPALNNKNVIIAGEDGSIASKMAKDIFPDAQIQGIPQNAPYTMKLDNVAQNKADATLVEGYVGLDYLAHNPGSLKNASLNHPVTVYPNLLIVNKGEFKLQTMLQGALNVLHNNGSIDRYIDKYEKYPRALIRVKKPYIE